MSGKLTGRITVTVERSRRRSAASSCTTRRATSSIRSSVDDDGRYTYHLSPGQWTLNVWDAHGHRGKGEVTLDEGEQKNYDIDLQEPEGGH